VERLRSYSAPTPDMQKSTTSRRDLLLAAGLMLSASAAHAQETCSVFTKARQSAMTPELALARLRAGNVRFVAGRTENCDLRLQVHDTAKGQAPFAAVLGCMDSRVRPEVVLTNASANSNPRPPDYKEVSSARLCADISFNSRGSFLLMNCSMCPTGTGSIASAT
jgi:hypothetical protein